MLKPPSCFQCPLEKLSNGFTLPEGTGSIGVAIIGEGAGYNEYLDGLPFRPHAQAGSKLEEAFKLCSKDFGGTPITRSQFLIYNLVQCNPFGDKLAGEKYEQGAIEHCRQHLDGVLGPFIASGPRVILALGNLALKYLCGVSGIAKEKQSITHLRGFVFQSRYGLVVPSYHPSFIRRGNNHLTPLLVEDLKRAIWLAKGQYSNHIYHKGYVAPQYETSPGLDEGWSFYYRCKDSPKLTIGMDIENRKDVDLDEDEREEDDYREILLMQFSLGKHEGIAFPYVGEYIKIADAIFSLPNVKMGFNWWNHDAPIVRANGHKVEGKVLDLMWMWKHWHPRLPRGLQSVSGNLGFPFPWKHLFNSQFEWYGCADVASLHYIISKLPNMMVQRGVWEGYKAHVLGFHPVLERARNIGIPVNEESRQALEIDFKEKREELNKELQTDIPEEIRNIRPKRKEWLCPKCGVWIKSTDKTCDCGYEKIKVDRGKKSVEREQTDYGYVREPKIIDEELPRYTELSTKLREAGRKVVSFEEYLYRKYNLAFAEFKDGDSKKVERWCIIEPFKASSDQLIRYLKWKQKGYLDEMDRLQKERDEIWKGRNPELTERINDLKELAEDYEVPTTLKTNKETTNKKELEEMYEKTGDEVLEKVVKIRSLDVNINNYLQNWKPGKDGRVRPTFGFTAPQGQINTWRPNGQNVSKHTEFGNEFRGIIEAPQGYCFIEFDKKSFHVATMGYIANDANYIRFSQIDPHSILGSYIDPTVIGQSISLKWSDADVKLAADEFKKRCKIHKSKDPTHNIDVRQELAKPTVLGNQLELGAKKLQRQNRKFIHYVTRREREYHKAEGHSAEELQDIVNQLFNRVTLVKGAIKQKAHLEKFLMDEWFRIQYFYDVFNFSWSKTKQGWTKRDGEGAREPIAFRVQGSAFGMITQETIEMEKVGICEEHNWIMTIHDSNIFMPEIGKRDKCLEEVFRYMNAPCSRLVNEATGPKGLVVKVEAAMGFNWKAWDKDKNPRGMQEVKV